MLQTATIVFREILEIALILGIVMAATRGMQKRGLIAISGLCIGALGAGIIAFFTEQISQAIEGTGQEIFNACVLFTAVAFLGWTVLWMKRHARDMVKNINAIGQDVLAGRKSLYVLVGVIALATFREGAEIVLFSYGMLASGAFSFMSFLAGFALGAISGTIVGALLYFGLLKTFKRHLFTVTSWMLIVLTAGMASQGASFLIAAGILPELGSQIWDTSAYLSTDSFVGETLKILAGYSARPSGMELLFYGATLTTLSIAYVIAGRPAKARAQAAPLPERTFAE
jgi:high-affinity iron transporter